MSGDKPGGAGPEWFAPKRYGYGASLPIAWQGWALLIGFFLACVAFAPLAIRSIWLYLAILAPLTALFLLICKNTTKGGWRWRNGED